MEFLKTVDLKNVVYVEAIKDGEIIKVPESVARQEDLFVLRRLEPSNKLVTPYAEKKTELPAHGKTYLHEWKAGRTNYKRNNVVNDLVENFQWEISKARRLKNISRKQLADAVGATEEEMKMMEMGQLPRDDFVMVNKIESYLAIHLRKNEVMGMDATLVNIQKAQEKKKEMQKPVVKKEDIQAESIVGKDIEILDE